MRSITVKCNRIGEGQIPEFLHNSQINPIFRRIWIEDREPLSTHPGTTSKESQLNRVNRRRPDTTARIREMIATGALLSGFLLLFAFPPQSAAQETKENPEFKMALGLFRDGMFDLALQQFKN